MAESLGDKLKRIAAEKKAARELAEKQASAAGGATPEVEVSDVKEAATAEVTSNEQRSEGHEQPNELGTVCADEQLASSSEASKHSQSETTAQDNSVAERTGVEELYDSPATEQESNSVGQVGLPASLTAQTVESPEIQTADSQALVSSEPVVESSSAVISERTTFEHPLSMQFAEMEQALLSADPTFKTILRDVHRQLGNDPELVTMMTEDEIQLVVRGLIVHAKAEIIEPAKAKTVKKAVAEAKKKAISADDL